MNQSPFALTSGTVLVDSFRIDSVLGQGGYGLTYGGQDLKLHRPVAIKEFFPIGCGREGTRLRAFGGWQQSDIEDGRTRFLEEGRRLAQFRHEGIVPVYSAFEANHTAYLVMEWLRGHTLSQVVETNSGPLSVNEAVRVLLKVADALDHVHEAGLLHRDIKPDNVLRLHDGRVVLLDFGLATDFNRRGHYTTRQLQTTLSGGTPGYAPLEQYSQRADLTPATDIYALSATLYFLLTGQDPLPATDRVIGTALPEPHTLNKDVSLALSIVILEGMALEATRRPASVKEWANRVQNASVQPITSPPSISPIPSAKLSNQSNPAVLKTLTPLSRPTTANTAQWKAVFSPSSHHVQAITDLDFAPANGVFGPHVFLTAGKDGQVFVWDIKGQRSVRSFEHPAGALAARFSADGQLIFVGCDDQRLYVWDVETGKVASISDRFKYPLVSLAVSPLGNQIAVGCEARDLGGDWSGFLLDGQGQALMKELPTDYGYINSLDYSPNGQWLVQGSYGVKTIWNALDGSIYRRLGEDLRNRIECVRFSDDGKLIASSDGHESVGIWNIETGALVRRFAKIKPNFYATGIAFSPQQPLIAFSQKAAEWDDDSLIFLLDTESGQKIQKFVTNNIVKAIDFCSDAIYLAAGSDDDEPLLCVYSQV